MLMPCQSHIWCPFNKGTSPISHLCFWCSCVAVPGISQPWCAQPGADPFALQSFICCLSFAPPNFMAANTWISMLVGLFLYSVSHTWKRFIVNIFKGLCAAYSFKIHISKYACKTFDKDSCPVILPKHVLFLPCPPLPVWKHLLSHLCFGRMLKNLFLLFAHHCQLAFLLDR